MDSDQVLSIGSFVWAKFGSKWWPGILVKSVDIGKPNAKLGSVWVFWYGDYKVSEVPRRKIALFTTMFNRFYTKQGTKLYQTAVYEALEILATRNNCCNKSPRGLFSWAEKGFKTCNKNLIQSNELPPLVARHVQRIQNFSKKISDAPVVVEKITLNPMFVQVKEGYLKLQDVCIACIGSDVIAQHPLFEGGICLPCQEMLKENIFAVGNDGKNVCCAICVQPGSLVLCDNINCPRSFCWNCIDMWLGEHTHQQIVDTNPWMCFFCQKKEATSLLQINVDWPRRLTALFQPTATFVDEISMLTDQLKKPIRVLSLFDGISTGKVALDCLGIEIDQYYASEIDEDAMNVSKLNHPGSIIYIGDVTKIDESKIEAMCPIDLIIGGSPCNDLSLVNPKRKGIYDFSGTGPLFFEYFHVWKTVERLNGRNNTLLFLFENVASMRLVDKSVISSFLMRQPILIDAKYFSPQSRPRLFWGNIPGINL